jgi:hypothetical protein
MYTKLVLMCNIYPHNVTAILWKYINLKNTQNTRDILYSEGLRDSYFKSQNY